MGMIEHTFALDRAATAVREAVAGLEPACLAGRDAARLTEVAAGIERLAGAAKALLAKRAEETGAWRGGRAVSVEQWLAEASGCSEGVAREALATAQRVEHLPTTRELLQAGSLSLAQAAQVSAGAIADPASEGHLLRTASRSGMRGLRAEKERVIAAATDELEARRRAHRERHLRTWVSGTATHGTFSGPTEQVADLLDALEPLTRHRFDGARRAGRREPLDAYRFDALLDLARTDRADRADRADLADRADRADLGDGPGAAARSGSVPRSTHIARVRVDLSAVVRGRTEPGEVCEIPGVGPVSVAYAREVLSHGLLQLVITDGVDVQTVVSSTRHVPAALKIAIAERDPTCKVRGCDATWFLERHHTHAFAETGHTTYEELGTLCTRHHDLVTHRGHEIIVEADGTWDLRAPPGAAAA